MSVNEYKNYKCLNCGNSVEFDPTSGLWKCSFCSSEYSLEEVEKAVINSSVKLKDNYNDENEFIDEKNLDFNEYRCNNCGAEVIFEGTNTSTRCIYCKTPIVASNKLKGKFAPDKLIPFKITRSGAEELYKLWINKKIFAPKLFKSKSTISEIRGIYAPFWLFDANLNGSITAQATKVRTWSDSDYRYTETSHYKVVRSGRVLYDNVPVDSSTKLDDELMRSIEPYDYSELKKFNAAYLSGFLAERYDVGVESSAAVAKQRFYDFLENRLRDTMSGYATINVTGRDFNVNSLDYSNVMMPVFLLANKYKGQLRYFMINAQNGKIYGDTPYDILKIIIYFVGIFGLVFVAVLLFGGLVL